MAREGTIAQQKRLNALFGLLMSQNVTHVRLEDREPLGRVRVTLIGHARDLHGPTGVCRCCHGRAPA
jgi:hypothetical protein